MQWSWLESSMEPFEQVINVRPCSCSRLFGLYSHRSGSTELHPGDDLVPVTPPDLMGKALVVALEMTVTNVARFGVNPSTADHPSRGSLLPS